MMLCHLIATLATSRLFFLAPDISEDGRLVAFEMISLCKSGIGVMDSSTGSWQLIARANAMDRFPRILSVQKRLYVQSGDGTIDRIDLSSGGRHKVIAVRVNGYVISNGKLYFCETTNPGVSELFVSALDGTHIRQLTQSRAYLSYPESAERNNILVRVGGGREAQFAFVDRSGRVSKSSKVAVPGKVSSLGNGGRVILSDYLASTSGLALFTADLYHNQRVFASSATTALYSPAVNRITRRIICVEDAVMGSRLVWLNFSGQRVDAPTPSCNVRVLAALKTSDPNTTTPSALAKGSARTPRRMNRLRRFH